MKMGGLTDLVCQDEAIQQFLDSLDGELSGTLVAPRGIRSGIFAQAITRLKSRNCTSASGGIKTRISAEQHASQQGQQEQSVPLVIITPSGREADALAHSLESWVADDQSVAVLPSWETLPHERLSPQVDTMARRAAVLRRLMHPNPSDNHGAPIDVLIVSVRALLQPIIHGVGDHDPVRVRIRDIIDLPDLTAQLTGLGFERVDMVEKRGQISVRGDILDVFAPQDPHPLRIELWGDEVEEIRHFSIADQRAIGDAPDGLWAVPVRELLLTQTVRARAREQASHLPGAADILELASEGISSPGLESLAPILVDRMDHLIDLLPPQVPIILADPEKIRARADSLVATTEEFLQAAWSVAAAGGKVPLSAQQASFISLPDFLDRAHDHPRWMVTELPPPELVDAFLATHNFHTSESSVPSVGGSTADSAESIDQSGSQHATSHAAREVSSMVASATLMSVGARDVRPYHGDFSAATRDLGELARQQWRLVVTTEGPGPGRRITSILNDSGVGTQVVEDLNDLPQAGMVCVTTGSAGSGFVMPEQKLAVLTEQDLTGRSGVSTRDMRRMPSRRRKGIDPLALSPGDYIVHEQHGIGRFLELVSRTMGRGPSAVTRDYLVVEYAPSKRGHPGDRLFVPTDSLDQISKYSGSDQPALTRMGGADWAKTKNKARKAVKEIAAELIRLYAARQATKGHSFAPDTPWQHELEDAFPYVETPDQLVTIDEVKADMEKSVPMDRLLTGDVGYGKTEVAVRAAFKAVMDGKQVAILVPTTLLVQQHYETFSQRYAGFPIGIGTLSRFSTPRETRKVREGIADGSIDLVIGTHALLTGTVRFKNLGLVVIDEEQRFGVEHKETLKAMRADVDVLSMSATPIPRTLEMAVSGIREMSILQTPPEERQPVLTFVGTYSDSQVSAAIRRELLRDGQIFFIHNRVETINKVAAHIGDLVPEARVRVAHGKLSEHELERVIVDFWNQEFDVLVCTTIVETGLDISNANTLIVDRADMFGLSQLHQLRGRVGRGRERAYAYFFYPGDKTLTETAHERLKTIAQNSDLGSGLAVAQKDLEIRGAGNLLGGAQSGHIEGVGFDLYLRMVSDAVAQFRGEKTAEQVEIHIDLPIDAHIPEHYVVGERLRLEVYAKIAQVVTTEQENDIREELKDRYGPVPVHVDLLFQISRLREHLRDAGITDVRTQGKFIRFSPVELADSQMVRLKRLHPGSIIKAAVRQVLVPVPSTARIGGIPLTDEALINWVAEIVDKVLVPFSERQ